jgi:hypothetical protein
MFGISGGNDVSDKWDLKVVMQGEVCDVPWGVGHHSEYSRLGLLKDGLAGFTCTSPDFNPIMSIQAL